MNFLVLTNEYRQNDIFSFSVEATPDIVQLHQLKKGLRVAALVWGEGVGEAVVMEVQPQLVLKYEKCKEASAKYPMQLIVGLCRTQSASKVIQIAQSLGVKKLHFVRTEKTEKSYLQASIYKEAEIRKEIILGMAQSGDALPVEVMIHDRFLPFIDQIQLESEFALAQKILADTISSPEVGGAKALSPKDLFLAIGPEAGWNDFERSKFLEIGFIPKNYDSRIWRIEWAVIYGISQFRRDS